MDPFAPGPLITLDLDAVGPDSTSRRFVATVQEKVLQGLITTNEPRVEGWCVKVRPEHVGDQAESVYDAAFASVGSWIISHHMEALPGGRGLGLPEAVIDLMCRHLAHPIHSSAHANYRLASGMQNEHRNADGTRVWCRLFARGLAAYDPGSDRFLYTGSPVLRGQDPQPCHFLGKGGQRRDRS